MIDGAQAGPIAGAMAFFSDALGKIFQKLCDIANYEKIPDIYQVYARTTTGAAQGAYDAQDSYVFPSNARRVDLILYLNNATVQFGSVREGPGDSYTLGEIEYIAPGFYSIPMQAKRARLRATLLANQARYTLIEWV